MHPHPLDPLQRERLDRLKAEIELARAQLRLAQRDVSDAESAFASAARALAAAAGVNGDFTVDLEAGVLRADNTGVSDGPATS